MLFINADDWGLFEEATDQILTCCRHGGIHAVSAMTFMKDSERAAKMAKENGLEVGLHLNLTQELTGCSIDSTLRAHHRDVAAYLKARKMNQVIFNPFLRRAFDYVYQAQWEEFCRLYGYQPTRIDGHHHMHLCMNMLIMNRYPKGLRLRRNFSFDANEKGPVNRLYRYMVDRWLTSRFLCTDYFFSIVPIEHNRIQKIALLSRSASVEIMAHPNVEKEYRYLMSDDWLSLLVES
jgi:chitin disaccharide deacetylase